MEVLIDLDARSRRVLGSLLEKEQTTPEYYPLTLNALVTACNQTTNREPVMTLKSHEVLGAIHVLERLKLIQRVTGPRVDRWQHTLTQPPFKNSGYKALYTVLLLRGEQTPGELKLRTERMHAFDSLEAVDETLRRMASEEPPLAIELGRRPGQKESRWVLNLKDQAVQEVRYIEPEPVEASDSRSPLAERIDVLERQVREILRRLEELEGE